MAQITAVDRTPVGLKASRAVREVALATSKVEQLLGVKVAVGETPYDHVYAHCLKLLAEEIAKDPDGRDYSAMTDDEIASEINGGHTAAAPTVRVSRLAYACFPDPPPSSPRSIAALLADATVGAKVRAELEDGDQYRALAGDDAAIIALLTDTAGPRPVFPARLPVIFDRVPFAPNAIDADDVATARAAKV